MARTELHPLQIYADTVRYFGDLLPEGAAKAHYKAVNRLVDAYDKEIETMMSATATAMTYAGEANQKSPTPPHES